MSVSPETLQVSLRQRQGQTYLHGPALSTAAGTEMPAPSDLQPSALALALAPHPSACWASPLGRPLHSVNRLQLQLHRKARPHRLLTMGPLTLPGCALSGKTCSLPQHLSLKPTQSQCSSGSRGRGRGGRARGQSGLASGGQTGCKAESPPLSRAADIRL